MSEYQYYEFQAIDRPLDQAAQKALRSISSRGRITATSFTNHYEWGDFKGDPCRLMERWFDLHLYLVNWGTRRLMMRLPKRFIRSADLDPFLRALDWVKTWTANDNLIIDIYRDECEPEDQWDDGSGRLAALAPLRADVLAGDLRLFYVLWLAAVAEERIPDKELEPLPGIGPLTGPLEAFGEFFNIDHDLMQVAAESGVGDATISRDGLRDALAAIPDAEKTQFLFRLVDGDAHVAAELKRRVREHVAAPPVPRRSAGALRARAGVIRSAREQAIAKRQEAEKRRQAKETERLRRARLDALRQRGEAAWREVEQEIERRNASGYDRAKSLLVDLKALAVEEETQRDFRRRIASIRARHERKGKFIERLIGLEQAAD